ncbi:MAG: hypothetical protein H7Z75_01640 [Ferruginibacter sp.]|nr:hypothetical protein [Cytophagales bacterium]
MYVKAFIETDDHAVAALPQEAIVQSEGGDYVFLFQGKRREGEEEMSDFRMIQVQKGVSAGNYT